jgi:hypothetical protein
MAKKTITKTEGNVVAEIYVVNDYAKGLEHNYDVVRDNEMDVTMLRFSNNPYWDSEVKGTCAGSIWDDGDTVHLNIDGIKASLDYDQMERLTALILACNTSIMEMRKSTVIASLNKVN